MDTKEKIYRLLSDVYPLYISGEELANKLNISRTAIWKNIKALEDLGIKINAITNKGYKLISGDLFSEDLLKEGIKIPFFYFDSCKSTMIEARNIINQGLNPPFVVIANSQKEGKGRRGRSFISSLGGLYFTLCIKNNWETETITTKVCVALSRVLVSLGFDPQIKWVNDIYIENKKCLGILSEGIINLEENIVSDVLIGIGINYTTEKLDKELNAISLYPGKKAELTRVEFLQKIIDEIFNVLDDDKYQDEYKKRCFILSKDINVLKNGSSRRAKALDIDSKCHLKVKYEDNSIEYLSSGDVSIRKI